MEAILHHHSDDRLSVPAPKLAVGIQHGAHVNAPKGLIYNKKSAHDMIRL